MLAVGDRAPDFKLPATSAQEQSHEISLEEALQKFKALVLLFYVLDFTGG